MSINGSVLLTGGSGLLGRHLTIEADRPSSADFNITNRTQIKEYLKGKKYKLVIHAAAYTSVEQAENDGMMDCFATNVFGTKNLLDFSHTIPFVYISTEYAKEPLNYYASTKAYAEGLVRDRSKNHLIIRTLFKERPWKYDKAFIDQYTQGDYVDVIAPLIQDAIMKWNGKGKQLIYIGTGRKTIYELAKQTRDVFPISVNDIKTVTLPKDYA